MKNKIFISTTIVLALAIIGGIMVTIFHPNKQSSVKEFDVKEYQWEVENFSSTKNVGQVSDVKAAIEMAKKLWIDEYGIVNGQQYDPIKGREIEVFFDNNSDCWLIKTKSLPNTKESVPHTIIQKDGIVLAVWMG